MPTLQDLLAAEAAQRARFAQPNWMGNPLVLPQGGPAPGYAPSNYSYQWDPRAIAGMMSAPGNPMLMGGAPPVVPTTPGPAFTLPQVGVPSIGTPADGWRGALASFSALGDAWKQNVSEPNRAGLAEMRNAGTKLIGLGGGPSAAKPAATPNGNPWTFGPTSGGVQLSTAGMKLPSALAGVNPSLQALGVQLAAGGATITSGRRDAQHNKDVGGVRNSNHIPGNAIDVVPPKGMTTAQLHDLLLATPGVHFSELIDEKNHVHIAMKDPFSFPQLQGMNPALAGAIPIPSKPRTIELPDRPQMADAPARPTQEEIPAEEYMAKLREFAPKAFDEKAANEGRVLAVLAGIARGAASVDAKQGVGAVLAAMGAGAGTVQAAWTQRLKGERADADEAVRLFELGLARQGFDWKTQNRAVNYQNREAQWQDQRDKLVNSYTNKTNQWETDTRELLANNEILRQYDRDVEAAKLARVRTELGIIEFNTQLTNQQLTGQQHLDLQRFLYEDEKSARGVSPALAATVNNMAAQQGIIPDLVYKNKDNVGANALQGMAYIASNNRGAAINALGAELVYTQRFDLIPDKKKQQELIQLYRQDPDLAAAAAGRLLNEGEIAQPGSALTWARAISANGGPLATAFLRYAQQAPAKPKLPAPGTQVAGR